MPTEIKTSFRGFVQSVAAPLLVATILGLVVGSWSAWVVLHDLSSSLFHINTRITTDIKECEKERKEINIRLRRIELSIGRIQAMQSMNAKGS